MKSKTKPEILQGVSKDVKTSKFVERNTLRINYVDGTEAIRLHNTDVVTIDKNRFILNSGGYRTMTTKDRINRYAPVRLYTDKGIWYVGDSEFYDGIKVNKEGKVVSKIKKPNLKKIDKIKKQINSFTSLITKENIPLPSNGDCWLCALHDKKGTPMGELGNKPDIGHLQSHIKEKYMHGSLILNAMRSYGFQDSQIGVHFQRKIVGTMRRAVRRYLQKRLIPDIQVK